jgi:hypothetical protein
MNRLFTIAATTTSFAVIGLFGAAVAAADANDPPPAPSGTDVSSYGSFGDTNFGGSLGTDGYSASVMGTTLTSSGWPVSHTTVTGPMGSYDTTTNYSYEGGIEHWTKVRSNDFDWDNWYELTPSNYAQQSKIRFGSTSYECHNNVCTMVPSG